MGYRRKFFFGKYKGMYIDDVIKNDLQYIGWCINNVEFFKFNEEETRMYNQAVHKQIVENSKAKNYAKKYGY